MKILIVGPIFYNYNEFVQKALLKLGIEAEIMVYVGAGRDFWGYLKYDGIKMLKSWFISEFNKKLFRKVNEYSPDIILVIKGNRYIRT